MAGIELTTLIGHAKEVTGSVFIPITPGSSPSASPQVVSSSEDKTFKVWDCYSQKENNVGHGSKGINFVSFSGDGRYLVTCSDDSLAKIWEVGTNRLVRTLRGHQGPVRSCSYSKDGSKLATASDDTTVIGMRKHFLSNFPHQI